MPNKAVLVRDGYYYGSLGQKMTKASGSEGYYPDPIEKPNTISTKDGAIVFNPKYRLIEEGTGTTLSAYPTIKMEGMRSPIEIGEIEPQLVVGTTIVVLSSNDGHKYYYLPPETLDRETLLARWWMGFPDDRNPWKHDKNGKPSLDPNRFKGLEGPLEKGLRAVVDTDARDYMPKPDELSRRVSAKLKRSLSGYKRKITKHLAPIGGECVAVTAFWQKGIALLHVIFKINGVDPTAGQGVSIYKNMDFYYGPWCERVRQKDLATRDAPELLHDYPPVYTLREWISGPLYQTAIAMQSGDYVGFAKPKVFTIKGAEVLAYGTALTRDTEYGPTARKRAFTSDELGKAITRINEEEMREFLEKQRADILAGFKKLKFEKQDAAQEAPIFRVPLTGFRIINCFGGIYMTTPDMKKWNILFEISTRNHWPSQGTVYPCHVSFPVDPSNEKWGLTKTTVVDSPGLTEDCQHYQIPIKGCECERCGAIRTAFKIATKDRGIAEIAADTMTAFNGAK